MRFLRILAAPLLVVPVTLVLMVPMLVAALVKLLLPIEHVRRHCRRAAVGIARLWLVVTVGTLDRAYATRYEISGDVDAERRGSYLLVANHRSWVDVPVLLHVFQGRVPFYLFFLKRSLLWLPLIGQACWVLEYPFIRQRRAEYFERRPEKRGENLDTVRAAGERIRGRPATVVAFPEGRLFTTEGHMHQKSPFRHLLRPRAGGISLIVSAMGEQLDAVLDVTIHYPDGTPKLHDLLLDRVPRVRVHVQRREVPDSLVGGDGAADPAFRRRFQDWLNGIWDEKDALLETMRDTPQARKRGDSA